VLEFSVEIGDGVSVSGVRVLGVSEAISEELATAGAPSIVTAGVSADDEGVEVEVFSELLGLEVLCPFPAVVSVVVVGSVGLVEVSLVGAVVVVVPESLGCVADCVSAPGASAAGATIVSGALGAGSGGASAGAVTPGISLAITGITGERKKKRAKNILIN
jgi:hypothetical protein